jgi:outer membrane receptor protein involved in Fe transport
MFRYSRSRTVRAPQLNELFRGPAQTFVAISDNCSAPIIAATANAQTRANRIANCAALGIPTTYVDPNPAATNPGVNGPNPNLREEEGTSQTFSLILTPRFTPGLEVVIDYYDIQIGNVINTVGVQNLLNLCVDNAVINAAACSLISRDPVTFEINNFTQGGFNYASQRAKGIDFAARYDVGLSDLMKRNVGELELGIRGNYSIRRQDFNDVFNPAIATDLDSLVGEPRVRYVAHATYSIGDFAFTWEGDYQASQEIFDSRVLIDDPDNRSPSLLETGDFWQHDFTMRYQFDDRIRFRAGVINAFDAEPSAAAELAPVASPSAAGNVDQFDLFGRRFFAGVNVRF